MHFQVTRCDGVWVFFFYHMYMVLGGFVRHIFPSPCLSLSLFDDLKKRLKVCLSCTNTTFHRNIYQIDFRKDHTEDAQLTIEIWDWDNTGDDDFISRVVFTAEEIKRRCCTTVLTQKQGKVKRVDVSPLLLLLHHHHHYYRHYHLSNGHQCHSQLCSFLSDVVFFHIFLDRFFSSISVRNQEHGARS